MSALFALILGIGRSLTFLQKDFGSYGIFILLWRQIGGSTEGQLAFTQEEPCFLHENSSERSEVSKPTHLYKCIQILAMEGQKSQIYSCNKVPLKHSTMGDKSMGNLFIVQAYFHVNVRKKQCILGTTSKALKAHTDFLFLGFYMYNSFSYCCDCSAMQCC